MMNLNQIVELLQTEVRKADRPANRVNYQQFFKEKLDEPVGLRGPVLKEIANTGYKAIKDGTPTEIMHLCDQILETDLRYRRFFAFDWTVRQQKYFQPSDFARFERWLKKYVDNWGTCDSLCCGPLGLLVARYPELAAKTRPWRKSKNRWHKRASAVTLIVPVRQGLLFDEVLAVADVLLEDPDDMVQKGYGWTLKEATKKFPDEVFDYVMRYKDRMPRTALRYAIEKLPTARRKLAMAK
jgi:3-methyladenine DNA glycosylase AlkD